ncbi:MAG: hypothetical protein K6F50_07230 [Kiritimatiellae bacterium]|nr:hypothetical protein [Kiritimatiellia bacterium]
MPIAKWFVRQDIPSGKPCRSEPARVSLPSEAEKNGHAVPFPFGWLFLLSALDCCR